MIRPHAIAYVLGVFLLVMAGTMLVPLVYGWATGDSELAPLIYGFLATVAAGSALYFRIPTPERDLNQREGILMTVSAWFGASLFGALPFAFSSYFPSFTDAFFESTSGFSTTGATVLADVEVLPPALQLWRHLSHWLGGMGVVLLGVAILPLVGHGGMHMYRAEFSGAKSEKLRPRVAETAISLWRIYFAMTAALYILLRMAGMDTFDALCHAFSTMSTGGFSTRAASVGAFSPLIQYIIVVFMVFAAMSFVQHYRFWVERRPGAALRDIEIRALVTMLTAVAAILTVLLYLNHGYEAEPAFRSGSFQAVALLTGTGFVTDDYEAWHPFAHMLLLAVMFIGGCTGSTAGGLKVSRVLLLAKVVDREFKRMVERRGVFAVRLGGEPVPERTVQSLLNLIYLAFVINFVSCLILAATGVDVLTSIAAVAASMFNVGPGLGGVGPMENYGGLPAVAKWTLAFCMIAGRLEFYTTLVILTPAFWRK